MFDLSFTFGRALHLRVKLALERFESRRDARDNRGFQELAYILFSLVSIMLFKISHFDSREGMGPIDSD
jgi:hypothetical protein